jgi:hypothetical protein
MVLSVLFLPLDVIWSSTTLNAYTGTSMDKLIPSMLTADVVGPWIVVIVSAAIWIPYILRSKRVANTFSARHDVGSAASYGEWSNADYEAFKRLRDQKQSFSSATRPV